MALRRLVERELPALVLLDVGLPGEDGFVAGALAARAQRPDRHHHGDGRRPTPSTAWSGSKPAPTITSASPTSRANCWRAIKSVLRRVTGPPAATGPRVRMGRRVLDLEKRVLVDPADGSEETLTASEFDLLKVFAENPNRPLQRDWLLEVTAHREMEAFDRAIDLRITRLRRKIEVDPAHPDAIRTVRGVGYMFVPPKD